MCCSAMVRMRTLLLFGSCCLPLSLTRCRRWSSALTVSAESSALSKQASKRASKCGSPGFHSLESFVLVVPVHRVVLLLLTGEAERAMSRQSAPSFSLARTRVTCCTCTNCHHHVSGERQSQSTAEWPINTVAGFPSAADTHAQRLVRMLSSAKPEAPSRMPLADVGRLACAEPGA